MQAKQKDNENNKRLKKIASVASIAVASSLTMLKVFAAMYTGSLAVLSSLIDSLADIFASSVTFIAVKFSSRPATYKHRYGYGKAESISALVQSAFVAGSGIFVLYDGVYRLFFPSEIEKVNFGILIMVLSLIATIGLISFQKYVAKKTKSLAIEADSAHYTVDVATNISIIITLIVVEVFQIHWFDTLTAIAVAAYLLFNAYKLAVKAMNTLTDAELEPEVRNDICRVVMSNKRVKGLHDLRTRDLGGPYWFEFHLELDGEMSLVDAHEITDMVEGELLKVYPDAQIIIHQDPAGIIEDRLDNRLEK